MGQVEQEGDYRQRKALSSGTLADFYQSQDHVGVFKPDRATFQFGHVFEAMIRGDFKERFFFSDTPVPDEIYQNMGALESLFVTKKDGGLDARFKSRHTAIENCLANPGKTPIHAPELERMAENFLKIEWRFKMSEIVENARFNVPIYWGDKKALVDTMVELDDETLLFDIKTAASFGQFISMLKSRYWIQDQHYSEGAETVTGCKVLKMYFAVACKEPPYLAKIFSVDDDSRLYASMRYDLLCEQFREWDSAGRPTKGWLPAEEVKIFIK